VKGPGAVLEIQASGISVEAVGEREEFYGEMAWMLKGDSFAERLSYRYIGQGRYELIWKAPRKTWAASERRLLVDLDGEVLELLQIRRPDVTPWRIEARFLSADDIYELVLGESWIVPSCAQQWYEQFYELYLKRKRYENVLDGISKFIEEWWPHSYHDRQRLARLNDLPAMPSWLEDARPYTDLDFQQVIWKNIEHCAQGVELWLSHLEGLKSFHKENEKLKLDAERRFQDLRDKEEAEKAASDLAFRREQEAAAKISAEKARQLALARQREAEAKARAIAAAKTSAELLQQASLLVQEAGRGNLCDKIIALRPVSVERLGKFSTAELADLLQSFAVARDRLGANTWQELVEAHRA
jgi:hypothetical protein